jgi:hypothetical protein
VDFQGLAFRFSVWDGGERDDVLARAWASWSQAAKIMTTSSYKNLSHSRWDCKYHIVFIPECRKKEQYGKIQNYLGGIVPRADRAEKLQDTGRPYDTRTMFIS